MYTHPPPANAPKDLRAYWTKVHETFIGCRGFIAVMSRTRFAILPTVVKWQRREWKRVCRFSQTRATNRLPQQRPSSHPSQSKSLMKPIYLSIFPARLTKINLGTLLETCVHPPTDANEQQDLTGYWTKVHEIFVRHRGIIIDVVIVMAIFPSVVKCQHGQQKRDVPTCRRLAPQNWLPRHNRRRT